MITVQGVAAFLNKFAPARLAEEWDNVGLLVGDRTRQVSRLMTCLTVTPATAAEAVTEKTEMIVSHHPLPFRPVRRLTTETTAGRLLLELIGAGIAVYSPHTAFDSARVGVNQRLAKGLGLRGVAPLVPAEEGLGSGRWGWLDEPATLEGLAGRVKTFLGLERVQVVGDAGHPIRTVGVACGSAGELLEAAIANECDCFLTGETRFHTCLEAEARGVALILTGHFASERFAVEYLAEVLQSQFPELGIWASRDERDPLRWA